MQPEDWGEAVELEIAAARAEIEHQRWELEENFGMAQVAHDMAGRTLLKAKERVEAVEKAERAVNAERERAEKIRRAGMAARKEAKAVLQDANELLERDRAERVAIDQARASALEEVQRYVSVAMGK